MSDCPIKRRNAHLSLLLRHSLCSSPSVKTVSLVIMDTLEYITAIADKKRCAFAIFSPDHKRPYISGEIFNNKDAVILRLKDWSCTQGFVAVIGHGHGEHKKREIQ